MRKVLVLAVCGAGLLLFGSEKSAKAQCVSPGYGYGSGYTYNAPAYFGGGFNRGFYNRGFDNNGFYGNPYYRGGSSIFLSFGGRRGHSSFGFFRRGHHHHRGHRGHRGRRRHR